MQTYAVIPRASLVPPPQPLRAQMSNELLEDLASSIRALGILEPLIVTPVETDSATAEEAGAAQRGGEPGGTPPRYEIIDGHRRYLASDLAGLSHLPCMVFPDAGDARWAMMLHANICREDVTPAEEGLQFLELAEKRGWSMAELTRFFHRSESYINARAVLVRDYPDLAALVAARKLGWSVSQTLMRCTDVAARGRLAEQCVSEGASVRTALYYVEQWLAVERAAHGFPGPHTPAAVEHMTAPPAPEPQCLFCGRDHDRANLVMVPIHWYHRDDMVRLLEQLGVTAGARREA